MSELKKRTTTSKYDKDGKEIEKVVIEEWYEKYEKEQQKTGFNPFQRFVEPYESPILPEQPTYTFSCRRGLKQQ